jgi:hypothetical protein
MSPRRQILKLKLAAMLGLNASFDADCDGLLMPPPLLSSSRERQLGEFALIDPYTNFFVTGFRFDLSAEEVIEFCDEYRRD